MKKFIAMLWIVVALFFATNVFAANTLQSLQGNLVRTVSVSWTSASDGTLSDAFSEADMAHIRGYMLCGMLTDPAASSDAPDDNYDITLKDATGYDLLGGMGANRDTANTEYTPVVLDVTNAVFGCIPVVGSSLTFAVTGAGNANKGVALFYFIRP